MTAPTDPGTDRRTRTYSGGQVPRAAGWGNLGLLPSLLIAAGVPAAVIALLVAGWLPALVLLLATAALVALCQFRDKHGLTLVHRLTERRGHRRRLRDGTDLYRSGPLWARTHRLPGLAAQTTVCEHDTVAGQPFALLHTPTAATYTTVLEAHPDGGALLAQDTTDAQVAAYGGYLAGLGEEDGCLGAAVIIDVRPTTGEELRAEVDGAGGRGSPVARQVMTQVAAELPTGGFTTRGWATATFTAYDAAGRRRAREEMALDLGTRLPVMADGLAATGAGAVRPATGAALAEAVRCAYDPAAAPLFAAARAAGEPLVLPWHQAGPVAHEAGWDWYRHDGGWSVTWTMTGPPKTLFTERVLARLLAPHRAVPVKRVAILYTPYDPGDADKVTEADRKATRFTVRNPTQAEPTWEAMQRHRRAERTAEETAQGAGVLDWSLAFTATVTDPARLAEARTVVNGLRRAAKLLTRPAYGGQDTAFAYTLPLGLIPALHGGLIARYGGKL